MNKKPSIVPRETKCSQLLKRKTKEQTQKQTSDQTDFVTPAKKQKEKEVRLDKPTLNKVDLKLEGIDSTETKSQHKITNLATNRQTVEPNYIQTDYSNSSKLNNDKSDAKVSVKSRATLAPKSSRMTLKKGAGCDSETQSMLETTPSGSSTIKLELKEFNNLMSQLHQWIFINIKLEQNFKVQQQNALNEIYDRWIQIFKLIEDSYGLERSIFIQKQIVVLNKSLVMQNDYYTDISLLFDQFQNNAHLLLKKVSLGFRC